MPTYGTAGGYPSVGCPCAPCWQIQTHIAQAGVSTNGTIRYHRNAKNVRVSDVSATGYMGTDL